MILSLHPAKPGLTGLDEPAPKDWFRYRVPWMKGVYKIHSFGSSLIQEIIKKDFSLHIWTLDIKERVCLYPTSETPVIAIQFMLLGDIDCVLTGFGEKLLRQGSYEMFYVPMGYNEAWFAPGLYETLHLELQPAYLNELIDIRPEIRDLFMRLLNKSIEGKPMGLTHINYRILTILQNLRTCKSEGAFLQLELHKFILELLSEYFRELNENEKKDSDIPSYHKNMLEKIKNHILLAPNIRDHTVAKLTKSFGISSTAMARAFKKSNNMSLSKFVHQQVMAKSRYLLTTTDKSIEEIAEDLGYAWRPAFEYAFKKFYHHSPGTLRTNIRKN